ncbi:aquaporin-1-like [Centruroides vittatus]|uniref:aquaporin-1-like n=1 Tax=Centruroides vittatus TaxID=120091 RepID=UPI0035106463
MPRLQSIPEGLATVASSHQVRSPVEIMRRYMESFPEEISCREEMSTFQFWKAVRTEFLATLLLTVMGCGSCLGSKVPPSGEEMAYNRLVDIKVSLAFGFSVATLVQCVGQISGAHMNPAVSVAFLVVRHITAARAVAYVLAQCLGATSGAIILYGLTPLDQREAAGLGATELADGVHVSQAFGMEFMASFLVVLTVLANVDPHRTDMGFRALSIGLSYVVGHFLAFRYTGASINPARSLGPAVVTNSWRHHWVYWVGPVLGGVLGAITYDYTQDTSRTSQHFKRSFRKRSTRDIIRDQSALSNETEMTGTSNDFRI